MSARGPRSNLFEPIPGVERVSNSILCYACPIFRSFARSHSIYLTAATENWTVTEIQDSEGNSHFPALVRQKKTRQIFAAGGEYRHNDTDDEALAFSSASDVRNGDVGFRHIITND